MRALIERVAETTAFRDRDSIHQAVAHMILNHVRAESVGIFRLTDDEGVTRLASHVCAVQGGGELEPHLAGQPRILPALSDFLEWAQSVREHEVVQFSQSDGMNCPALPIEADRDVIGLLAIRSAVRLDARDVQLVGALLRILTNHLALLDYGERNTLTGMLNRKTFEKRFEKLRHRLIAADAAQSTVEPSWLGLVDIDRFKLINDSHGHLSGAAGARVIADRPACGARRTADAAEFTAEPCASGYARQESSRGLRDVDLLRTRRCGALG